MGEEKNTFVYGKTIDLSSISALADAVQIEFAGYSMTQDAEIWSITDDVVDGFKLTTDGANLTIYKANEEDVAFSETTIWEDYETDIDEFISTNFSSVTITNSDDSTDSVDLTGEAFEKLSVEKETIIGKKYSLTSLENQSDKVALVNDKFEISF